MLALLPMKGNSERIPNKNLKTICGKPLFFHIADKLKKTNLFDNLVINTDSKEIISLANDRYKSWVTIIERPHNLRGDNVSMNSIIEHDLSVMGFENDYFQTHSTNPLLETHTIKKAVKEFYENKRNFNVESIFSVTPFKKRLYDHNLKPINHNPKKLEQTQNLKLTFEENSNFYIFSGKSFLDNNHRIGKKSKFFIMNQETFESLDIDEKNDWNLAEILLNLQEHV